MKFTAATFVRLRDKTANRTYGLPTVQRISATFKSNHFTQWWAMPTLQLSDSTMITCYVHYTIKPSKLKEFEQYARMWIPLVEKFGGVHHGYFLPSEGANDVALCLFSFDSLAAYEQYRIDSSTDSDCLEAVNFAAQTQCIERFERSFFRPILK